jgi:hypothetical protein
LVKIAQMVEKGFLGGEKNKSAVWKQEALG